MAAVPIGCCEGSMMAMNNSHLPLNFTGRDIAGDEIRYMQTCMTMTKMKRNVG